MKKSRILFAALIVLATLAGSALWGAAPITGAAEEVATECRQCVQQCPSGDFCWCAIDWCGDVCSEPPDCDVEIN